MPKNRTKGMPRIKVRLLSKKAIMSEGLLKTAFFLNVLAECRFAMERAGELTQERKVELEVGQSVCIRVLRDFFGLTEKEFNNLYERLNPEAVAEQVQAVRARYTSRLILPGQGTPSLIRAMSVDAKKIWREVARGGRPGPATLDKPPAGR